MVSKGRPRSFDRQEALEKAMNIFWAKGYEGTTLAELQEAMGGITAPSFYAAFGSKESLFHEVVSLYSSRDGASVARALEEQPTARAAIETMLYTVVDSISRPGCPHGCLLVVSAVNCLQENQDIQNFLSKIRASNPQIIRQRLQRGIDEGDLPKKINTLQIANFVSAVVNGLSLQARDGASRKALRSSVECTMAAWDKIVSEAD